jgi:RNA polymerase sigma-70 factor (ECF subfamily)
MSAIDPSLLATLLARCALSDQAAFANLYQTVASRLTGIAYRVVNNKETANEVVQEAFVQIWNKAGEYRSDKAEPMTWMASIVRYRAFDRLKFEKRRFEGADFKADLDNFDDFESAQKSAAQTLELDQSLSHCLKELEPDQRESILMAYYYGYSREEIADKFSSPVNTIKSWLRRGIERLQLCLAQ